MRRLTIFICVGLLLIFAANTSFALDAAQRKTFNTIMNMTLVELTEAAGSKLEEKYPGEDWRQWHFPDYVMADRAAEVSYKIAVKEHGLLGKANISDKREIIPCYCTCKTFGHANLLACFWKDGVPGGSFDVHGSQCAVCMRQAFLAFLWADLGADHADIIEGMERKFAPLIEKYHQY